MPILYKLFNWDEKFRYTLTGFEKEQDGRKVLVFYADEPEIRMYEDGKMTVGYKKEWTDSFGDKTITHEAKERAMFDPEVEWLLDETGVISNETSILPFETDGIREEMESLIKELEAETGVINNV